MRDPDASLRLTATHATRTLHQPLPQDHFLRSALATRWVEEGRIVPFSILDERTVSAPRLRFVSRPDEWCDAQLHACARLTLDLQIEAVRFGFDLKDASAWNVIHRGTQPILCDLMSFEPLTTRRWWAAGQFARHFIVPLWLSRWRGFPAYQAFRCWRDGVPSGEARRMAGTSRYATRYWPLLADAGMPNGGPGVMPGHEDPAAGNVLSYRESLHASLRWMLDGVAPRANRRDKGTWSEYVDDRDHYAEGDLVIKRQCVARWLDESRPGWVLDLGCNTGEFSLLALDAGAEVVALDADHASVQRLYLGHQHQRLHTVVAAIDDLPGSRGWAGGEHAGLGERLENQFDMVLMLGLVHHLAIGASVPLLQIAMWARRCTRRDLIVEFVDGLDVRAEALCRQRRRDPAQFSIASQQEAFLAAGFDIVAQSALGGMRRSLVWLRRTS